MTLVDLMASLSAVALVLTLGVPSFRGLQADMQRTQVRYALMGSFSLARAEAIRSAADVTVCPSTDAITCTKDSQRQWGSGWIVVAVGSSNPKVIDTVRFSRPTFSLLPSSTISQGVTFNSIGLPSGTGTFVYADQTTRCAIRLSAIGHLDGHPGECN